MMPVSIRPVSVALLLAALLGCERPPFDPPGSCDSCPAPVSHPPVVSILTPHAGDTITRNSTLLAAASDDRQVIGVEFYRAQGAPDNSDWVKLHPGVIPAQPYYLDLSRYPDRLPPDKTFIYIHAVAYDVEGNADTATVRVLFNWTPP